MLPADLRIDIHTHILPERWPDFNKKYGCDRFIRLEHHKPCCARMLQGDKFFREVEDNCWSASRRMEECDTAGVHVQVLSTVPVMFSYWAKAQDALEVSRLLNDHIASVVQNHPKRFIGLGTVPLQDPDLAIPELERCIKQLGLDGVEIGTHINDWNLNAPELSPFFEAADELGAAIFVHPWDMMGQETMQDYWLSWLVGMPAESSRAICSMIFGGIFERHPNLRVCFAHGGGSFPATLGRIEHGYNVRPDLVAIDNKVNPRDYLGHFFLDSLVHDKQVLQALVELVGPNRVALGSDYPFPLGEHLPGNLISTSGFDAPTKQALFSGSALAFLNRDSSDFL
jgi:aminocarboxymuconate-semialdehyde decarboxylase